MALTQEGRNTETQLPSEHPFDIRFQVWVSPAAAGLLREPRRRGCCSDATAVDSCGTSSRMQQQQIGGEQQDAAAADGRPGPW